MALGLAAEALELILECARLLGRNQHTDKCIACVEAFVDAGEIVFCQTVILVEEAANHAAADCAANQAADEAQSGGRHGGDQAENNADLRALAAFARAEQLVVDIALRVFDDDADRAGFHAVVDLVPVLDAFDRCLRGCLIFKCSEY